MTDWTIVCPMENHITSIYQLAFLIAFSFFVVVYLFTCIKRQSDEIKKIVIHDRKVVSPPNKDESEIRCRVGCPVILSYNKLFKERFSKTFEDLHCNSA